MLGHFMTATVLPGSALSYL